MIFPALDRRINDRVPWATYALVAFTTVAYLAFALHPAPFAILREFALWPSARAPVQFVSYTFLHGNWLHIVGNMFFLWFFGSNVERRLGPVLFLAAYFTTGVAAGGMWLAMFHGPDVPLVGASGAIAGLMGLYVVLFAGREITLAYFLVFTAGVFQLPAFWFLILYVLIDLFNAMILSPFSAVAHWAHVGGFLAGVAIVTFVVKVLRMDLRPILYGTQEPAYRETYEEFNYLPERMLDEPAAGPPVAREVTTRIFRTSVPGHFALLAKSYVAPTPETKALVRAACGDFAAARANCIATTPDMDSARRMQEALEARGMETLLYPAREMLPDPLIVHATDLACREGWLAVRDEFGQTHSRPLKDVHLATACRMMDLGTPRVALDLVVRRPLLSYRWKAESDAEAEATAKALHEALRASAAFTRSFYDLAGDRTPPHRVFASDVEYNDYLIWAVQLLSTPFYRVQRRAKSA